jgi:hypothetical protein
MAAPLPRQYAKLQVRGLKVNTVLGPDALPPDLVPPEPLPAGDPVLDLELEGGGLVVRARLNGKSVRRALKQIAELGAGNVIVTVQGNIKTPPAAGEPFVLDAAGLTVAPKTKPAGPPAPDTPAEGG